MHCAMTRNRRGAHVLALCAALPAAGALSAAAEPPAFVYAIDTIAVFEALTVPETFRTDLARAGKYLAPAREDPDLLPVVFQDVSRYPRHIEFMAREFPDRFPALTPDEYVRLVERRATRSYWVGMLLEIHPADGGTH